jgi:AraC-like DNA-binding protein
MSELARKPAESSHALHTVSGPSAGPAIELAREKHYSIIEIAERWALSEKTVRKIFEREPGVAPISPELFWRNWCLIHWSTEEKVHKRGYRTLRVPETVLHRVHRKLRRAS